MRKSGVLARSGDTIPYIMCVDINQGTRPRMVDDVRNSLAEIGKRHTLKIYQFFLT